MNDDIATNKFSGTCFTIIPCLPVKFYYLEHDAVEFQYATWMVL
jgi:hypothetical protein